jgi:ATP adenylyltransferase
MDHLWTPWRSAYIKAEKDHSRCVFCDAAACENDEETLVVYRADLCFILLNRYPYTNGHLMIAPCRRLTRP